MVKAKFGRIGMAVLVALTIGVTASDLAAQFQPAGALRALAPANNAKSRPKPPFDLTGAWLHNGNARTGGEAARFDPPPPLRLTPPAQHPFDAASHAPH